MNTIAWKCYRCDLTFKEKFLARIHQDLSNHPVRQIELIFHNSHPSQKIIQNLTMDYAKKTGQ